MNSKKIKLLATVALPLVLGGCGLPVAVQIASLVADGISFAATDKTLTDHGLSAVAGEDCAVWRGIKGEDICRETDDGPPDIPVADLPAPESAPGVTAASLADTASPGGIGAEAAAIESDGTSAAVRDGPVILAHWPAPVELLQEDFDDSAEISGVTSQDAPTPRQPAEISPQSDIVIAERVFNVAEQSSEQFNNINTAAGGGAQSIENRNSTIGGVGNIPRKPLLASTYYVIASYYRSNDAEHFARKHEGLNPQVISGTARGKPVYRVAFGPVRHSERKITKRRLNRSGFRDAWAIKLKQPDIISEVASID